MSDDGPGNCDACPVPPGLRCYRDPARCRRAARPGEEAFRAILVKHALARAAKPRVPLGTRPPAEGD